MRYQLEGGGRPRARESSGRAVDDGLVRQRVTEPENRFFSQSALRYAAKAETGAEIAEHCIMPSRSSFFPDKSVI